MKRIIYTDPTGHVCIVTPAYNAKRENESESEFLSRVRSRSVPEDATNIRIVDESEIPSDRTFRNAWKHDFSIDLEKAKDIARSHVAMHKKNGSKSIQVDNAASPAELKTIMES